MTGRAAQKDAFLAQCGWQGARRAHLAGDASARSYERLSQDGVRAVLMDAPPGSGEDVADFLKIGSHLAGLGLSPPQVLGADAGLGFVLLEDLGDDLFTAVVDADPAQEAALYHAAADVLLHLQACPAPASLPDLSAADWAEAAMFSIDWYRFAATGERPDRTAFRDCLQDALTQLADGPRVLILRDYHAGNLLWLPQRTGLNRVGLLDFQQAQMGQPGYDLVSLLQDARRDVQPETETAVKAHFARQSGQTAEAFAASYAALGAQRALRILGIFARLSLVGGKPGYLRHMPRVWDQLLRNLAHPGLADLRARCLAMLPAPSPEILERITLQCGSLSSH